MGDERELLQWPSLREAATPRAPRTLRRMAGSGSRSGRRERGHQSEAAETLAVTSTRLRFDDLALDRSRLMEVDAGRPRDERLRAEAMRNAEAASGVAVVSAERNSEVDMLHGTGTVGAAPEAAPHMNGSSGSDAQMAEADGRNGGTGGGESSRDRRNGVASMSAGAGAFRVEPGGASSSRVERQEFLPGRTWDVLQCRMCHDGDTFHAQDSRGLMQHLVRMHLGQTLSAEAVA